MRGEKQMKKKTLILFLSAFMAVGSIFSPLGTVEAEASSWKSNHVGWWWQEDNGSYPVNTWKQIGGTWYAFDQRGYMRSGWYWDGSSWYYLGGANDGAMKTGWQKVNGTWYYMYGDGRMASNAWIGNYWVDGSGAWTKTKQPAQWIKSGNRWWYRHEDGGYTMNGFETIGGKTYYFDGAGWMVTGWRNVNNKWYYFDGSGAMRTNAWIGDYYVGSNGVMATNTWIGNYYVDGNGKWVPNKKPEHVHNFVEQKETIHHEEQGHFEKVLVKEAYEEVIHHDKEGHWEEKLVKEAWVETIHHEEEGHWEQQITNKKVTINHPEEGHWEERAVVDGYFCNTCGEEMSYPEEHFDRDYQRWVNGEIDVTEIHGGYHNTVIGVENVWVVDREAWTEVIDVPGGYEDVYVVDKEAWDEKISHDAEYEQVWVEKEAWDEIISHDAEYEERWIVDQKSYDEVISKQICSGCGAIK